MSPDSVSLGRRLLIAAGAALAAALVVLVAVSSLYARQAADSAFDRLLAAAALSIAGAVQAENEAVALELPFAALSMLGYGADDRIYYQVLDPAGTLVTGYADLAPDLPRATSTDPVFVATPYRGETIRVATVGRLVSLGDRAGWVTVRVGQTRDARTALASELTEQALVGLAALATLALLLVAVGIRRALGPLRAIETEIRQRAPSDLSPVAIPVPTEVRELVSALNDFMGRLGNVFARLSSLLADAAHQVRTPLASLRAQAEIALEENDPERLKDRLRRIHANAVQASQLVSQILMDATVSHRLESRDNAPVAIGQVVDDVQRSLAADALERLTTVIAPEAAGAEILGDRVALREMLKNLVENAALHGHGSPVELTIARGGDGTVTLTVADRGPGIPDGEKALVLKRFRRGAAAREGTGSGLGLSIVDSVARGHGGALRLADRPGGGLVAEVTLPAGTAASRTLFPPAASIAVVALLVLLPQARAAEPSPVRYPASAGTQVLAIAGTTDRGQFEPLILDFQQLRPDVSVVYTELDTVDLNSRYLEGSLKPSPDMLISSAIDLQVKLANDGHALAHDSALTRALPAWARWRGEVFGFTFEPAVPVWNPRLVPSGETLQSREALVRFLVDNAETMRGKIATYDIVRSGVGHLLAAEDAEISSALWRLTSAMGNAGVQRLTGSGDMIDRVERGELALAYNVLGSYAFARKVAGATLGVTMLRDYTLVLSRAALIPRTAANPEAARAFLDYLLSPRGQAIVATHTGLGAIQGTGPGTAAAISAAARGPLQPVALRASLLTFLDQQRRTRFLQTWLQLVSGF
ncbi:extracellular solute-binding protein [uncultured Alsobacter sp.]|uniref:sensor histidine kinase n=1 Tax=uncultured Alsobacter sp. TaxID=1748258 RepID=UPI0025E24953|nr:extracellular solute-binding protein [uncultured Alsobacter sp.]